MLHQFIPIQDPLLLKPGNLIIPTDILIGVETGRIDRKTGTPEEVALMDTDIFMYLDVQPSRRSNDHYRFKILSEQFIFVEATLQEFRTWFRLVNFVL